VISTPDDQTIHCLLTQAESDKHFVFVICECDEGLKIVAKQDHDDSDSDNGLGPEDKLTFFNRNECNVLIGEIRSQTGDKACLISLVNLTG